MKLHGCVVLVVCAAACGDGSNPGAVPAPNSAVVSDSQRPGAGPARAMPGGPSQRRRAAAGDAEDPAAGGAKSDPGDPGGAADAEPFVPVGPVPEAPLFAEDTSTPDLVARAIRGTYRERGLIVEELARRHPGNRDDLLTLLAGTDHGAIEIVGDALTRCAEADRAAVAALETRAADATLSRELRRLLLRAAGFLILGATPSPEAVRVSLASEAPHVREGALNWLNRNWDRIAAFRPELEALIRRERDFFLRASAETLLESIPGPPTPEAVQEAVAESRRLRTEAIAKQRELAGLPSDPSAGSLAVQVRTLRGGASRLLPAGGATLAADEPIELITTVTGPAVQTALDRGGPLPEPTIAAFRYDADGSIGDAAVELVAISVSQGLDYRAQRAHVTSSLRFPESAERRRQRVDAIEAKMRAAPEIAALLDTRPADDPKVAALRAQWDSQVRVNAAGRYRILVTHPILDAKSGATQVLELTIRAID